MFSPLVEEANYQQNVTNDLIQRVFRGNVADLVAHLLKNEEVYSKELDEIRRMIDERG